jgi:hypothetical protein
VGKHQSTNITHMAQLPLRKHSLVVTSCKNIEAPPVWNIPK